MNNSQTAENQTKNNKERKIGGVMVTYHAGSNVADAVLEALAQVDKLYIADNGGDSETLAAVDKLQAKFPGRIELLAQPENNLAAAQNSGIRQALADGAEWVLLLDQDSRPAPGMVQTLLHFYDSDPGRESIGLLAPYLREMRSAQPPRYPQAVNHFRFRMARFEKDEEALRDILCVVSSGSLIPASSFEKIGFMEESLGIDYVDKDFCLRLREAGLDIVAVRDAMLEHQLGASRDHKVLGVNITATNHSPARRYTIYRNRILTMRRFSVKFPNYVVYECAGILYDMFRIAWCEEQKKDKFRELFRGLWMGFIMSTKRP